MGYDVKIDVGLQKKVDDHFYWVAHEEQRPVSQTELVNENETLPSRI